MFKIFILGATLITFATFQSKKTSAALSPNEKIDISGFLALSQEVEEYREDRLIDIETFNRYASESGTIILDTRSKKAFDDVHIENALHLNFSDFTEQKLAQDIPDKTTRILIYCNNNLRSKRAALMDKRVELALNIPTFINLYGYGYTNIYELNDYLEEDDESLKLVIGEQNGNLESGL